MTTEELLRTLDSTDELTAANKQRGDALLERTVREPVDSAPANGGGFFKRPHTAKRIGLLLVVGAVISAIAISFPVKTPQSAAIASWTPTATAISPSELVAAENECRKYADELEGDSALPLILSERRGDVVALLFYQGNPETAVSCVLDLPEGTAEPRSVQMGSGGSSGSAAIAPPDGFIEGAVGQYMFDGESLSVVTGAIGADVESMTVTADGVQATATISQGLYALWLPGVVFGGASEASGQGGPETVISYELVLTDGTVVEDARSSLP